MAPVALVPFASIPIWVRKVVLRLAVAVGGTSLAPAPSVIGCQLCKPGNYPN
jgi:hypothetical protein